MQKRARRYTVKKRADQPAGPYYAFWTEKGRQRKTSLGIFDPHLAKAEEDRLNAEAAERRVFGRAAIDDAVSFAYAALAFLESSDTPDQRAARARFLTIPIERLGDTALRDIDDDVMRAQCRAAYPLAAPATRRRQFYGPVWSVLKWSSKKSRQWCAPPDFDLPPDSRPRLDWLTPARAALIVNPIADPRRRVPFELAFGAGLRASEIARLDFEDLFLPAGQARVRGTKTAAADRMVDLPPRCVAAIANLDWKDGPVCRTPKGEAYVVTKHTGGLFNEMLATAARNAKQPRITMHVARHSWATWRADADPNLMRLMTQGGWTSLAMVQRYAKAAPRGVGEEAARCGWTFTGEPGDTALREINAQA